MKPNSQLERLKELMRDNKMVSGKIVEVESPNSAHNHGKEKVIIKLSDRIPEFECECGVIFKLKGY